MLLLLLLLLLSLQPPANGDQAPVKEDIPPRNLRALPGDEKKEGGVLYSK